jgi:hypothetical protein
MRLWSIVRHARLAKRLQLPSFFGSYKYEPLPTPTCIRLLELVPSVDNKIIRCSLRIFELQDAPSFKALSYTWGDSHVDTSPNYKDVSNAVARVDTASQVRSGELGRSRRHSIICDGRLIKVTSNLRDAMRMLANATNNTHMTMSRTPSYYWIDALCMDQSNIPERNDQVERMGDVFKKADGVIVWLGKEDEFTIDALKTMRTIAAIPEGNWPLVPYTSFYEPEGMQPSHRPNLSFYNWLGFM